jgi:hypothetical protein
VNYSSNSSGVSSYLIYLIFGLSLTYNFSLSFLLKFVFLKSSFTNNEAIKAINQPTPKDIKDHHLSTCSTKAVIAKVNGILSNDPQTKINPHPIDSPIG